MSKVGKTLLIGAGVALTVAVAARDTAPGKALRRGVEGLGRRARYSAGRLEGMAYRLAGRTPDPAVPDDVLADRIRSDIGRLEKRLDVPHVHVMVEDHVALLHGEVPSAADRLSIEWAVRAVPGVRGIESYLHVGLLSGSTRPSEGRARAADAPSPAMRELIQAARDAGATEDTARLAIRAVLATFAERIPHDEREQLLTHLPNDVRELASVPRREGDAVTRERTVAELVAAAVSHGLSSAHAAAITESVLGHLRRLVPEEVTDVAAVLPEELRELWTTAVPG
ncbi:MAG: DUF2267 domain-containing protein [Acidimicrobiia bacterium]